MYWNSREEMEWTGQKVSARNYTFIVHTQVGHPIERVNGSEYKIMQQYRQKNLNR